MVPVFGGGGGGEGEEVVVAVLDVDCRVEGGFDGVDEEWLARLAALVGRGCDWGVGAGGEKGRNVGWVGEPGKGDAIDAGTKAVNGTGNGVKKGDLPG